MKAFAMTSLVNSSRAIRAEFQYLPASTINRRPLAIIIASIVSALLMSGAHAQSPKSDALRDNDQIVVTATRTSTPLADTLAQVSTISRSDIAAAGNITLTELLERRAGVEIRATGGPGQPSSIFIRGANATHTLVLVDGLRIGSSTSGSTAFENIPLDVIDRIEVVKGPRSGLYGSDAIGGVIQIFTRRSSARAGGEASVSLSAGNSDARNANIHAGFGNADTRVTIAAGSTRINPGSASNPLAGSFTFNPDNDPYRNVNGKVGFSHRFNADHRLSADLWESRGKTDFDGGAGTTLTRNDQTLRGAQVKSDNRFHPTWRSQLQVGETVDDITIQSAFGGRFKTSQQQLSWQNDFSVAAGTIVAGVERRDEDVSSTTNFNVKSRTTNSFFAAVEQTIGVVQVSGNVRRDNEDQFGNRTTGGATVGLQPAKGQWIYASGASAFRAPSFNDLYFPGFSNPLLQPEKSRSSELGWRMTLNSVKLSAAWFDNKIENLIAFDFVTSRPQNVQRARIRGVEASAEWKFAGIDWRASVTSQSPKNTTTNRQLRSRAKNFGSLGASQTIGDFNWSLGATASDARFDSANESPVSRMPGYVLWDARLSYRIDRAWRLEFVGSNLTDREYTLARGYNQLGTQFTFGVRWDGVFGR
jgi:vitamin B12 transporter